ncbi:hypothetical protein [Telmatospirillum siberiense]|nr:hypothetical protein [Telmatospirillum siberiense]
MTRINMTTEEHAALWRRRLFEAEAGMTNYLLNAHGERHLAAWMDVRSKIFHELPSATNGSADEWKSVFFRAQALLERFLVGLFGHEAMTDWARSNAEVLRLLDEEGGQGPVPAVRRIAQQAELYDSTYTITERSSERSTVQIDRCAIWIYREKARARGVPITLGSPCEYCTRAMAEIVRAKGCTPNYELLDNGGVRGCRWTAIAARLRPPAFPAPRQVVAAQ